MERIQIAPEEISNKFKSKQDIYKVFKYQRKELVIINIVGYFLPSYKDCNMKYLRKIINGEKKANQHFSNSSFRYTNQATLSL